MFIFFLFSFVKSRVTRSCVLLDRVVHFDGSDRISQDFWSHKKACAAKQPFYVARAVNLFGNSPAFDDGFHVRSGSSCPALIDQKKKNIKLPNAEGSRDTRIPLF